MKDASTAFMNKIFPLIFDRISKWGDIDQLIEIGELDYFFSAPSYETSQLVWKESTPEKTKFHLTHVLATFLNASEKEFESPESVKGLIFEYATEAGRGHVLWPVRVALSGKEKSPDPFTLASVLGKEEVIARIKNGIRKLE
jgi:glutamyl/glutaminyl-tRNA synthetase